MLVVAHSLGLVIRQSSDSWWNSRGPISQLIKSRTETAENLLTGSPSQYANTLNVHAEYMYKRDGEEGNKTPSGYKKLC